MTEEELIVQNVRLAWFIASKYKTQMDYDEACSIASLGLVKAAKAYKPDKGVRFSTYAGRCIHNELNMAMRKEKVKLSHHGGYLDSALTEEDVSSGTFYELHAADINLEQDLINKDNWRIVNEYISEQIPSHQFILLSFFGISPKRTQNELAAETGYNQSGISRICKGHCKTLYRLINKGTYRRTTKIGPNRKRRKEDTHGTEA